MNRTSRSHRSRGHDERNRKTSTKNKTPEAYDDLAVNEDLTQKISKRYEGMTADQMAKTHMTEKVYQNSTDMSRFGVVATQQVEALDAMRSKKVHTP